MRIRTSWLIGLFVLFAATMVRADAPKPVKVFILAGQSNMEGKASLQLLDYQADQPTTRDFYAHLRKDGKWIDRDDVWIKFLDREGKLTVGYGSRGCIGPELEFGNVVGDHFGGPILLIKTAWGGRSLYRDFRPPSAGFPPDAVLERMLADAKRHDPNAKLETIKDSFGASYRAMIDEVRTTLSNLKSHVPTYAGQGYELSGFVWFQGWNDMINPEATAEYAHNLAALIRDVRNDLKSPNLPMIVGQMGVGGVADVSSNIKKFKDAQAQILEIGEFKGNVALVKTDVFWDMEADAVFKKGWREHPDDWNKVGSNYPFHYLGSAKTYCLIGRAFAESMITLRGD